MFTIAVTLTAIAAVVLAVAVAGFRAGDRRHCTHDHPQGRGCNPRCVHGTKCPAGVTR